MLQRAPCFIINVSFNLSWKITSGSSTGLYITGAGMLSRIKLALIIDCWFISEKTAGCGYIVSFLIHAVYKQGDRVVACEFLYLLYLKACLQFTI